jgi:metallo-beta-lactamase class B
MRAVAVVLAAALSVVAAQGEEPFAQDRIAWNKPVAPFHLIGPVYYVGTAELAIHLVKTKRGLILIDGGLPESVPLIEANIEKLGFKLKDIRVILVQHAHFDHAGGLAQLKKDTGAMLVAGFADKPILARGQITFGPSASIPFPPVKADHDAVDGMTLQYGGLEMEAHGTPGHTPGCVSWTLPVEENGTQHKVLFACSTTVAGNPLVNVPEYPNIASDYRHSFAVLKSLKADVLLTEHQEMAHEIDKAARAKPGAPNPFVDAGELARYTEASERAFEAEYARQQAAATP